MMLVFAMLSCESAADFCNLEATASTLAGEGAEDCGLVEVGADGTEAWACALAAQEAGEPYTIRYERGGIDTLVVGAMVSDGAQTWELSRELGGNANPGIDGWDCISPVAGVKADDPQDDGDVSGYPVVTCTSREPEGNHYQVCGLICGPQACQPQPLPFEP